MKSIGSESGSLEPSWTGRAGGLWTEVFGEPDGNVPALLLSEAEAPSTRWPDELISALIAITGAVIRFDTRDAGRNGPETSPYALADLAADAIRVLDDCRVDHAHLVGRSMGGMVAQIVALDHPDRVRSLTLLSTTGGPAAELQGPEPWLIDKMADRLFGDRPESIPERADWIVDQLEWFAGRRYPFDRSRAVAAAMVEAEHMWHEDFAHGDAVVDADSRYERLAGVGIPTLIVHGTADPVYPADHGLALADRIPSSHLELIDGLGHELPPDFSDQLAELIGDLVGGGENRS